MKKELRFLRVMGAAFVALMMLTAQVSMVCAAAKTFSATGEYTMSDYETPEVAEQRAFAYAQQRAAEQAGVYIASYTKSINAQISEDKVNLLAGTLLEVKRREKRMEKTASGDIHIFVEITADVDTSAIDQAMNRMQEDRNDVAEMYADLQRDIRRQEKENEELKQKIAALRAKGESTEVLVKESKAQEREFLSNQKLEECQRVHRGMNSDDPAATEKGIMLVSEAIRLNPKNAKAYVYRGLVLYGNKISTLKTHPKQAGNADAIDKLRDEMIADYSRALAIDPNDADIYRYRGHAYKRKQMYDEAIADFSRALALNPSNADAYFNRAYAYQNKGLYDEAIADFSRGLDIKPNATDYTNRAQLYSKKGLYDEAIADFSQAIAVHSDDVVSFDPLSKDLLYFYRGNAYFDKGLYDKAIADYSQALVVHGTIIASSHPFHELWGSMLDLGVVYNNRGTAYALKGEFDAAIADFNRALAVNPNDAAAYYRRGFIYGKKDNSVWQWRILSRRYVLTRAMCNTKKF
ncbi:MAG: tetratricopeptide repeat protein [Schwartzia sp.]|nr:tetratricopeptide repeat protein [Schwartzia sp. (in: firmicutes)]